MEKGRTGRKWWKVREKEILKNKTRAGCTTAFTGLNKTRGRRRYIKNKYKV